MKHTLTTLLSLALSFSALQASEFIIKENLAQYGGSDYQNVVRIERGISLDDAKKIASEDPNVDYFVFLKGGQMVLPLPKDQSFEPESDPFHLVTNSRYLADEGTRHAGFCRIFRHGDTVFFKKEGCWLGSAPGYADAYFKEGVLTE